VGPGALIADVDSPVPPNGIIGVTIVATADGNFVENDTTHDIVLYDCDNSDDNTKWTSPPITSYHEYFFSCIDNDDDFEVSLCNNNDTKNDDNDMGTYKSARWFKSFPSVATFDMSRLDSKC